MNKVIVILGPTASGKSDLAVRIAKQHKGEVVSADSRQIYKGLNIGAGKITKKEMMGIPHHLLDVANPKNVFTVSDFKKEAEAAFKNIHSRNKLPIMCGGTGFYIQSITDGIILPEVPPNAALRLKLSTKSAAELFALLKKLDLKRAKMIDKKNPHRLIRAIEIAKALGKVPSLSAKPSAYEFLQIGILTDPKKLRERIHTRLIARLKKGMFQEAINLHKKGLSWKRMEALGLEYRYLALYLQNKLTRQEMIEKLESEIWHYAKRQMTWFKRDKRIKWFKITDAKKIEKDVRKFLGGR